MDTSLPQTTTRGQHWYAQVPPPCWCCVIPTTQPPTPPPPHIHTVHLNTWASPKPLMIRPNAGCPEHGGVQRMDMRDCRVLSCKARVGIPGPRVRCFIAIQSNCSVSRADPTCLWGASHPRVYSGGVSCTRGASNQNGMGRQKVEAKITSKRVVRSSAGAGTIPPFWGYSSSIPQCVILDV